MGSIPAILDTLAKLRPQYRYRKKSKPYLRLGLVAKRFSSVRELLADRKRQTSINFTRKRFRYKKFLTTSPRAKLVRKVRPGRMNIQSAYRKVNSPFDGKLFFRFKASKQNSELSLTSPKTYNSGFLWFPKDNTLGKLRPLRVQGFHSPSKFFNENTSIKLTPLPYESMSTGLFEVSTFSQNGSSIFPHFRLLDSACSTFYNLPPQPAFSGSVITDSYQAWVKFSRLSQNLRFKQEVLRNNVLRLGRTREVFQFFNYHSLSDLQLDKRVKILIPDLNITPRGSFWSSSRLVIGQPKAPNSAASKVLRSVTSAKVPGGFPTTLLGRKVSRKLRHRSRGVWRAFTRHIRFRSGRSRWLLARWKRRGRRSKRKVLRRKKGAFKQLRRLPFFLIARRRRNQRSNKFSQSVLNSPKRRSVSRHPTAFYSEHERVKAQLTMLSRSPLHSSVGKLKFLHLHKIAALSPISTSETRVADHVSGLKVPEMFSNSAWTLHLSLVSTVWLNPLFFKYLLCKIADSKFQPNTLQNIAMRLQSQLQSYVFGSAIGSASRSNLWVAPSSNYVIRKKLLRSTSYSLFSVDLSLWYYKSLTAFIEDCSGRKVALRIGPFLEGALTFEDRAYCSLWGIRVTGFQRMLGHKIFAHEALMLVALSFRLKDPTFLANWIRGMLKRLSFWKYRLIFRYLKFLFQHIFRPNFRVFGFRGLKLRLKGKISVAGNARTRTLFYKVGDVSHSKMDNKVAYDLSYVNTFTGIMGFKLWFFY